MTPMLVCVPFWKGDMAHAMDVCRIMAGLQPHPVGEIVHVMLVARQDCTHDINMVNIVNAKFKTFTYVSNSPLRGWPQGPNGMFGSTMIHISNNAKNKYECIYWMEPDALPICPNWFIDLLHAWRTRHPSSLIVGCRSDCNGDGTGDHITGCALYDPNIARKMPELTMCSEMAWDYQHRAKIVTVGGHTPLIENWYNARNADPGIADRDKVGVRIIHGFKDRSVVQLIAKKFNIKMD